MSIGCFLERNDAAIHVEKKSGVVGAAATAVALVRSTVDTRMMIEGLVSLVIVNSELSTERCGAWARGLLKLWETSYTLYEYPISRPILQFFPCQGHGTAETDCGDSVHQEDLRSRGLVLGRNAMFGSSKTENHAWCECWVREVEN